MVRYWPAGTDERTLARLRGALGARFERLGVERDRIPLSTPATAGIWLLAHSGTDMTALAAPHRELIHATACQHRIEWWGTDQREVPALYYYDGKAMYLGLTDTEVGVGPAVTVIGRPLSGSDRGRVRVAFTVPADWTGPGLLPVARPAGGYDWPRQPGTSHESWCSCAQARHAVRCCWSVTVQEHLALAPGQPLRAWGDRLATLYQWAGQEHGGETVAACYRAICLHAIGALHRIETRERLRSLEPADLAGVRPGDDLEIDGDGNWAVRETAYRLDRWSPEQSHPEWSAGIWSACQYRITRTLMEAVPGSVLGVWGDAVYTTAPLTQVYREGDLGRLRLKRHVRGPLRAPESWSELRGLLAEGER